MVDESTAVLVPADAPDALATAIVDVLAGQDEAQRRAVRARDRFLAELTIDRVAARMADFYRGVLGRASDR